MGYYSRLYVALQETIENKLSDIIGGDTIVEIEIVEMTPTLNGQYKVKYYLHDELCVMVVSTPSEYL